MIAAIDKATDELIENLKLNGYDMLDADDRALIFNSLSRAMSDAAADMRARCRQLLDSQGYVKAARLVAIVPLEPK